MKLNNFYFQIFDIVFKSDEEDVEQEEDLIYPESKIIVVIELDKHEKPEKTKEQLTSHSSRSFQQCFVSSESEGE